jgi:hypothetical protein
MQAVRPRRDDNPVAAAEEQDPDLFGSAAFRPDNEGWHQVACAGAAGAWGRQARTMLALTLADHAALPSQDDHEQQTPSPREPVTTA